TYLCIGIVEVRFKVHHPCLLTETSDRFVAIDVFFVGLNESDIKYCTCISADMLPGLCAASETPHSSKNHIPESSQPPNELVTNGRSFCLTSCNCSAAFYSNTTNLNHKDFLRSLPN
ncbi:MAG: hypothetical protein M0T73_17910, partial [Deltaproteobacteria bacterium]|nr:hypothetical protein [Deltaproteobacteria bacterium]